MNQPRLAALIILLSCIICSQLISGQCIAITKTGNQCNRRAEFGATFCWQHNSSKTNSVDKSRKMNKIQNNSQNNAITGIRCTAITKKRAQCLRNAQKGTFFCKQHSPNLNLN